MYLWITSGLRGGRNDARQTGICCFFTQTFGASIAAAEIHDDQRTGDMDFELTAAQQEIVRQVRALCDRFPDEYWRRKDSEREGGSEKARKEQLLPRGSLFAQKQAAKAREAGGETRQQGDHANLD
jgi:hypothetical protein